MMSHIASFQLLHETHLTPVICHKHLRCHDGVTLCLSMKFPSIAPKTTSYGHFWIYQQISAHLSKNNKTTKKEENLNWTLVNTENLRAEIAACQRQYYM